MRIHAIVSLALRSEFTHLEQENRIASSRVSLRDERTVELSGRWGIVERPTLAEWLLSFVVADDGDDAGVTDA